MGEVVTATPFLRAMDEDAKRALAAHGVTIADPAEVASADLDLPVKGAGEIVVGHLTVEEAGVLYELVSGKKAQEGESRAKLAQALEAAAAMARDPSANITELQAQASIQGDEALGHFRLSQRNNMLYALLHWMLGERLGLHDWRLGCRRGGLVVKIERRW